MDSLGVGDLLGSGSEPERGRVGRSRSEIYDWLQSVAEVRLEKRESHNFPSAPTSSETPRIIRSLRLATRALCGLEVAQEDTSLCLGETTATTRLPARSNKMPVPTYDKFIEPILRYLAEHSEGAAARDVHEAAAVALGLSDANKQQLLPSGRQPVYKNRAGWAHDRLKRAGLSDSVRRGFWRLTAAGLAFAKGHASPLSVDDVEELATGHMDVRLRGVQPPTPPAGRRLSRTEPYAAQLRVPMTGLRMPLPNCVAPSRPKFSKPSGESLPLSSRLLCSIFFTAWVTGPAGQIYSELVGQATAALTGSSR